MNLVTVTYGTDHTDHTNGKIHSDDLCLAGVDEEMVQEHVKQWKSNFTQKACAWYAIVIVRNNVLEIIEDYHPIKQPIVLNPAAKKMKTSSKPATYDFWPAELNDIIAA